MKVSELMEILKTCDQDLPVMVRGYEDGIDDITSVEQKRYKRDANKGIWYYGQHETVYSDEPDIKDECIELVGNSET